MPAAAFAANFVTFGTLFSFGVFLTPLVNEFDSNTGPVASLFSAAVCLYYVGGAIGGRYGDRHGSRPVVALSAVLLTAGLLLTAAATQLWHVFLSFGVLVGLATGFCYPTLIGLVGRTFTRHRATALGVLLAGVGTGTLISPVVSQALISAFSWRTAFVCLAAIALPAVGWAALVSDRITADSADTLALIPLRTLVRNAHFRRFYLAVLVLGPGFYAPLVFYNDYAIDRGIESGPAALLVGISGAASVIGRLAYGALSRGMRSLSLCRISYLTMLVSLVVWLVAGGSYAVLIASALLHGFGWAIWVTSTPAVLAQWLGVENLGGVIGIYYTGLGVGALVGPAAGGFIIDRAGFTPTIALTIGTTLAALLILLSIPQTADRSN